MSKVLLITGATGKQGGAVISALLANHPNTFTILAVTRNPSSPAAQRLAAKSPSTITLIQGDLDDVPALFDTAAAASSPRPIWGVYSVQVSRGPGVTVESEVAQGRALIDAARAAGVRHFVYSSVERGGDDASWDNATPIPHFQSKLHIERHLRDSTATAAHAGHGDNNEAMAWTIVRPVAFMDNLEPGFPTRVFLTALRDTLAGRPMQFVAVSDIGHIVAAIFAAGPGSAWNRRALGVAGDELTFADVDRAFLRATGSPAGTTWSVLGAALMYAVKEVGTMLRWFGEEGYRADVEEVRRVRPEVLSFESWLVKESGFRTERG